MDNQSPREGWGERTSRERVELRELLQALVRNPSNSNRHEEAIVNFIRQEIHAHTTDTLKGLEKSLIVTKADLAWCLGKLRGLGVPNERLEKKYQLEDEYLEGGKG